MVAFNAAISFLNTSFCCSKRSLIPAAISTTPIVRHLRASSAFLLSKRFFHKFIQICNLLEAEDNPDYGSAKQYDTGRYTSLIFLGRKPTVTEDTSTAALQPIVDVVFPFCRTWCSEGHVSFLRL